MDAGMQDLMGLGMMAVVGVAGWIMASRYLHRHHARWLAGQDSQWDAWDELMRRDMRTARLFPSWEMSDPELRRFIGRGLMRQFRSRRPGIYPAGSEVVRSG